MRKLAIAAAFAIGLGVLPHGASAQATVTQAQVVAACSIADNLDQCKLLIEQFIALYPAGSIELQQAIADLVVALASTPAASDPALQPIVAEAIRDIAQYSPDPTQAEQIVAIADTVAAGGDVQTAAIVVNRPNSPG